MAITTAALSGASKLFTSISVWWNNYVAIIGTASGALGSTLVTLIDNY